MASLSQRRFVHENTFSIHAINSRVRVNALNFLQQCPMSIHISTNLPKVLSF